MLEIEVLHPAELVAALEAVAARLGIPVRCEPMDRTLTKGRAGGGLVRLRGQPVILLDEKLPPRDRVSILAQALQSFDLDQLYLPPEVRETLRAHGGARVLEPRPLARAKPKRAP